ncbi:MULTISPECIES: chaplin [unclassified Streptomyces]|uniref:chaplin n=1 Tax=unclassified Streptomyces TaxID=2593676 RepID=UPI00331957F4
MALIKSAAVAAGVCALVLGGAGFATADSDANGVAAHSPGFLSGNVIQVPINAQLNLCGNTVNVIGLLNPAVGNVCLND